MCLLERARVLQQPMHAIAAHHRFNRMMCRSHFYHFKNELLPPGQMSALRQIRSGPRQLA
jgi:hypothetical protein